jgi:hypothetical protein
MIFIIFRPTVLIEPTSAILKSGIESAVSVFLLFSVVKYKVR